MAKIGKQWGTIIACWAVALALIITGICLGTIIPSKAADEKVVMVTCGDAVKYFTDISEVPTYVNHLPTTASQPATVTLLEDIHTVEPIGLEVGKIEEDALCAPWAVLDLAGHILRSDKAIHLAAVVAGSLTVIDSNPSVERYVTRNSTTDGVNYDFFDEVPLGTYADVIYGGVVTAPELMIASFYSGHELTINGGNYFGTGSVCAYGSGSIITEEDKAAFIEAFGFIPKQRVTINGGLFQVYTDDVEAGLTGNYGVQVAHDGELVINGGSIFGKVAHETVYGEGYVDVDLSDPQTDMIKINADIKMKPIKDADGNLVGYAAVDATTGEPITPDVPTDDTENKNQSTPDAKTNLIGLIVLGVAAAVMVVGVTTIIIVNTKKRKKVA